MSRQRLLIVGLAVGLAYSCVALGYTCFALPPIQPHQGDGVFEDLSRRASIFPITGYSIRFTAFDLGGKYEASFRFSHVPSIGKKCGVYLAIRDPDDHWFYDSHIKELQQGTVRLELLDSRGAIVVRTDGALKDYIWYGCRDLHGLYRLKESFFIPCKDEEYTLRIVYHPDPKLASYKGFGYLLCGGSK
jgi:hypothetical protein